MQSPPPPEEGDNCCEVMESPTRRQRRLAIMKAEPHLPCHLCPKRFHTSAERTRHIAQFHDIAGKNEICEICGARFAKKNQMRKHVAKIHVKQVKMLSSAQTNTATATTSTQENVSVGAEEQGQQRELQVGAVGASSSSTSNTTTLTVTQKQIDAILKSTPYECALCDKKFATEGQYKKHLQRHEQMRFMCGFPNCGKTFAFRKEMQLHLQQCHKYQTEEQEEEEENADQSEEGKDVTKTSGEQQEQVATNEEAEEIQQVSEELNREETQPQSVPKKQKTKTKIGFTCPVCSNSNSTSNNVVDDESDANRSNILPKNHTFATLELLQHHLREAHARDEEPLFRCPYDGCHKVYTRQSNLNTHIRTSHGTEEEKYKFSCMYCHKRFCHKRSLNQHMWQDHPKEIQREEESSSSSSSRKRQRSESSQEHVDDNGNGALADDTIVDDNDDYSQGEGTNNDSGAGNNGSSVSGGGSSAKRRKTRKPATNLTSEGLLSTLLGVDPFAHQK